MWSYNIRKCYIHQTTATHNFLQLCVLCMSGAMSYSTRYHTVGSKHSRASQTDHTAAANVHPVMARATRGAFQPHSGPPSLGCYHPTSDPGSLMWFGRTWWGRAGPKVISRTVTSETHFPTIKEREKLSGPNIACFHGIESNICMCVCVLWAVPPRHNHSQTHTHTSFFPTLNSDRAFPNVFTYKENHLPPKSERYSDWNRP